MHESLLGSGILLFDLLSSIIVFKILSFDSMMTPTSLDKHEMLDIFVARAETSQQQKRKRTIR